MKAVFLREIDRKEWNLMNGIFKNYSRLASLLAVFIGTFGIGAIHSQTYTVSIPSLAINNHERIVGFEIKVHSARIATLMNAPSGWNFTIDNDPSWTASISATVEVGAAALDRGFFQRFVRIEQSPEKDVRIELEGEVIVTADFVSQRKIKLRNVDFKLVRWVPVGLP
jgi:hypothetical protein